MEMKKYTTPEMEVIKLSTQRAVLQALSGGNGSGSTPDVPVVIGGEGEIPE